MMKNYISAFCIILFVLPIQIISGQNSLESSPYETLIKNYLIDKKEDYNWSDKDIEQLAISDSYYSENTGITQVYLNQTFQNIPIFNAISSVAIKNNEVFYYADRFTNDIEEKINATSALVSPLSAIEKLAENFQLGSMANVTQLEKSGNNYVFSKGAISTRDIVVKLVYTNSDNALRLSWDILVYAKDNLHWYSARIDAITGEIITHDNLVLSCNFGSSHEHNELKKSSYLFNQFKPQTSLLVDGSTYNVFALPTESPNHGPRELVNNPASTFASPFGWHDDDGAIGPEYTFTRGNNVFAQEDRDGQNETSGFSPDGTSTLNFDYSLDTNQPPSGYQDVSVTNLFYLNNMMHDIWYHHGFNERSGNFQANNYGNSGIANDFVSADAQDGAGINNATFGTPPDGQQPKMTMFLWSAGPLDDPLTINNGSVAGGYSGTEALFGAPLPTTPITANLTLTIDTSEDFNDACQPFTNSNDINGSIAIIRRGTCEFGTKVLSAENAGAIAAIVVNNDPNGTIAMGAGAQGNNVTIPSIMVSQADGEAIISALENGETLSATLVNNGPFMIDGDFDNGIIAHEYGHGISNRLAGGPSAANCLFNDEQMGEGWSDWFGLMVTMKATDVEEDARGIGTFAVNQSTTGPGIRPRRYSPDFTVNELTYNITNDPNLSQPHGIGFMWATMLWDLTWAYIDKYGFDSDLYNGNGGNNRIMRLVIDGLKLQPCSPGFVDGRDALLAADMATTGGEDQCMIWEVFAARGLGFNAMQGDSDSRLDQVEDFSTPPNSDPSLANCTTLSIDEFNSETLSVFPNPTDTELSISSNQNLGDVVISLVDINGRIVIKQKSNLLSTVTINTQHLESGLYILNIKGDNLNYNTKIIKN